LVLSRFLGLHREKDIGFSTRPEFSFVWHFFATMELKVFLMPSHFIVSESHGRCHPKKDFLKRHDID
jgi:hypothetical protein